MARQGRLDGDRSSEETLSLFLLSSFNIRRNGQPVNGRLGGKSRQLLKVLAAHRHKCLPKDYLIEMIWPDVDPAAGATSLKVAAHNLRSVLDPDKKSGDPGNWIVVQEGTYRLNPHAAIWIDVEAFRAHYARGVSLMAQQEHAEARRELERAEALYIGDYLEEDVYEDWTLISREELRDLHLDVLCRLANVSAEEKDYHALIQYSHKIILSDPCREDAYRMLIKAHASLNQIGRAGSWYAICRSTLAREVGSGPSPETVMLFESLFPDISKPTDRRTA